MKLFTKVRQHIILNYRYYTITLISFLFGIVLAAFSVFTMSELENKELMLYLEDFFKNMGTSGTDGFAVFKISVIDNLKAIGLSALFSLMIIGAPFIVLICAARGYMAAFVLLFLIKCYGLRAAMFFAAGLLPHWLIVFPAYAFLLTMCLEFSLSISGRTAFKRQNTGLANLLIIVFLVVIFAVASSLLQAYVEPWLISFVSKYYI